MSGEMDPINAGLWALAGFDKTCGLLADLREDINTKHVNDVALVRSLDMLISIYLERAAEDLAKGFDDADMVINDALPEAWVKRIVGGCADLSDKPLLIEIAGYAMCLAALSNYGVAPWRRFAVIIEECVNLRARVPA